MKKIKYFLVSVFLFVGSIFIVNAALPYEEGMKSMTLYTYDGVYKTTKITENHTWMRNALTIISDKKELGEEITSKDRITTVVIDYYDGINPVTIKCYGNNNITIDGKSYTVNYSGDVEQELINVFSGIIVDNNGKGDVSNPETGDNTIAILVCGALVLSVAIVSYRKRKLG